MKLSLMFGMNIASLLFLQVIGPFIDNPYLLFGDYSPDVMVKKILLL